MNRIIKLVIGREEDLGMGSCTHTYTKFFLFDEDKKEIKEEIELSCMSYANGNPVEDLDIIQLFQEKIDLDEYVSELEVL